MRINKSDLSGLYYLRRNFSHNDMQLYYSIKIFIDFIDLGFCCQGTAPAFAFTCTYKVSENIFLFCKFNCISIHFHLCHQGQGSPVFMNYLIFPCSMAVATYSFVRITEHKNQHHHIVRRPAYEERNDDDHRYA